MTSPHNDVAAAWPPRRRLLLVPSASGPPRTRRPVVYARRQLRATRTVELSTVEHPEDRSGRRRAPPTESPPLGCTLAWGPDGRSAAAGRRPHIFCATSCAVARRGLGGRDPARHRGTGRPCHQGPQGSAPVLSGHAAVLFRLGPQRGHFEYPP